MWRESSSSNPPRAAAIRGIPPSPAADPAAGGWGIPGSCHVHSVGLEGVPAGGAVEEVAWSAVVLGAALPLSAACAVGRSPSSWRSRIFGFLGRSRPLLRVDEAAPLTWSSGTLVLRLCRRHAGAFSSGGVELGWWCVGGRSGVCEESLLASPGLVADGRWCCRLWRALAVCVHRARFRHRVADGFCGLFHVRRCSRIKVRRWFGFIVSGVGSGVVLLCRYASCVCCSVLLESLYSFFV